MVTLLRASDCDGQGATINTTSLTIMTIRRTATVSLSWWHCWLSFTYCPRRVPYSGHFFFNFAAA